MSKDIKHPNLHRTLTITGTILAVILIPMLIFNCMFIVSIYKNKGEVPHLFGYMALINLPDYMSPEIESGDLIICKKTDTNDLKVGDIISFYVPKGQGSGVATLKISELFEQDGEQFFGVQDLTGEEYTLGVSHENVVGIYTGTRIPILGNIIMFMQSSTGLIIFIFLAAGLFIAYDLIRHNIYSKQKKEEVDALKAELEELKAKQKAEEEAEKEKEPETVT